jgi:hypothetical protein
LERVFTLARASAVAPKNEIEKSEQAQVEKFWTKHPPIPPNKPDAGDGK